jgi:hypothetical protein
MNDIGRDDPNWVRSRYDEAIREAHLIYQDVEDIAAYLILERDRLKSLIEVDEDPKLLKAIEEKSHLLDQAKGKMHFLLNKLHDLVIEKQGYTAELLASGRLVELGGKLGDFMEWVEGMSQDIGRHVDEIKADAKVRSEISQVRVDEMMRRRE